MTRHNYTTSGVQPRDPGDRYGRQTISGATELATNRKMRLWTASRIQFVHRTKNGIYDPYSYFHLVEELAHVKSWTRFTAAQLAQYLNQKRPQLAWDAVTVGRILGDLIDSWHEANPGDENQPLRAWRSWDGNYYEMTDYAPARAVLLAMLDDLIGTCQTVHEIEETGQYAKRPVSPLGNCPSLLQKIA